MSDDTTPPQKDSETQIKILTAEVKELQARVDRLEREMLAIGKMENAVKSIFRGGESKDSE